MKWSPRQLSFANHSDAFINIADGAVRSGKTHAALDAFARMCIHGPPGDFAVFGKTERTVKRNVIRPLKALMPGAVRYVQGSGELYVFGRVCHVIGAHNVEAEEKVRGLTLAGGYMNEVTLYPKEVFDQTIARMLSVSGARLLGDCNPDSPYHWLNTEYLLAGHPKDYLKRWRFGVYDNPILEPARVEMLKALYGPGTLFYRRNIDGEWVAAEGAVYQQWDERIHVVDAMPGLPSQVIIGIDHGTSNATVFLALGKVGGVWYVFDEYYHSGRDQGQKTNGGYGVDFLRFLERIGFAPWSVEVDPSAAAFKVELRKLGVRRIRDADNSVVDGIEVVSTALTAGTLKVLKKCEGLRSEFPSYVWDPKKQKLGEDAPMKGEGIKDHALDALRYGCMRALGRPHLQVLAKPVGA